MKKAVLIVGLAIVFMILLDVVIIDNSSSFTSYPVFCGNWAPPGTMKDFDHCYQAKALDRQTFSVDTSKNQVFQTSPDTSDIHQLESCTIQDGQHWSCDAGGSDRILGALFSISFSGGNFSEWWYSQEPEISVSIPHDQTSQPKMSVEDFGKLIQKKYPVYADRDASLVGQKALEKYPVYADRVEGTPKKSFTITTPPPTPTPPPPAKESVIFVTKSQWDSINNGKTSVCGLREWCDE